MITLLTKIAQTIDQSQVNLPISPLNSLTLKEILRIFFVIAGGVAMLVIALGAFNYTISRGDPNAIKKSKETIIYAVVGLIVTMTGYGIVTFVVNKI